MVEVNKLMHGMEKLKKEVLSSLSHNIKLKDTHEVGGQTKENTFLLNK